MKRSTALFLILTAATFGYAAAAETPKSLVASYDSLAQVILGANHTETNLVKAILEGHWQHGKALYAQKDFEGAAAEMALFANEGDNAVGGIRKRLLEGGHHHNAEGEAQGIFEPGYVVVTKKAKESALAAVAALRAASDDTGRAAAWESFEKTAKELLAK